MQNRKEDRNTKNTNILLVYAGTTTSADIMVRFMEVYVRGKDCSLRSRDAVKITGKDIRWADVVVIVRGADYLLSRISIAAHQAHRLCVLYIDDDLLSLYKKEEFFHKALMTCIGCADIIWTSNPNISEKYGRLSCPSARVVEAAVIDPWKEITPYAPKEGKTGILFAGSPSHEKLVRKYILPALRKVYKKYPDIRVLFVGYKGTSIDGAAPFIETTEWFGNADAYRRFVSKQNMQIGLAVVEDSEFGRCKFYNKYLEYSKLGVVGIYSACEPYTFAVKEGKNGFLTKNTISDWEAAIIRVINDPHLQAECVANAQTDLMQKHTVDAVAERIAEAIPEFEEFIAPQGVVFYFRFARMQNLVLRVLRAIRHPKRTTAKVISKIKERI